METTVGHEEKVAGANARTGVDEYRETVKRLIETEVKNVIDEEMKKAAQELLDEQKKAIRQMVEENKMVIREVVAEEKKAIWARAEELRRSISKLGLG